MNLNRLTPAKGSTRASKRIGRGNATGQGRTAGKGHKGYKSRSGTKTRFHFIYLFFPALYCYLYIYIYLKQH